MTAAMQGLPPLVQVYRNIHKSRRLGRVVYSIRDSRTRRVVGHTDQIILADAEFIVSEAGRQRVLRERAKNVHAYVQGTPVEGFLQDGTPVTYNPYKWATFVETASGEPVRGAALVELAATVRATGITR